MPGFDRVHQITMFVASSLDFQLVRIVKAIDLRAQDVRPTDHKLFRGAARLFVEVGSQIFSHIAWTSFFGAPGPFELPAAADPADDPAAVPGAPELEAAPDLDPPPEPPFLTALPPGIVLMAPLAFLTGPSLSESSPGWWKNMRRFD